jgi:uncharacterized protein YcbK (DUF882 family)
MASQVTNFPDKELACKCCGKLPPGIAQLRERLERLRELAGAPIIINSGHRCAVHNKRIGGAPKSRHLIDAADVRCPKVPLSKLYQLCEADPLLSSGGLALKHGSFLHIDCGPRRRWEYK